MLNATPVPLPDPHAAPEDEVGGLTRAGVFKLLGGGIAGAAGLSLITSSEAFAAPAASRKTDLAIAEFALTLEYLGVAFYDSALHHAHLSGEALNIATMFRAHERAHVVAVQTLIRGLGGTPHKAPTFVFGAATRSRFAFLRTSARIEEMCVEIINGAGPLVSKTVLIPASELVSVEARQAAWVRDLLRRDPAPTAFTPSLTAAQGAKRLRALGFIH